MSFSTNRSGRTPAFSSASAGGVDGAVASSGVAPSSSRTAPSPGTHPLRSRSDFSQPSGRPTRGHVEVDSVRHMKLGREQILTGANAHHKAVASNLATPSLNANPATWWLAKAIQDPMLAAYHSIGSTATVPRSVFEKYISQDGPTDPATREIQRLSELASQ